MTLSPKARAELDRIKRKQGGATDPKVIRFDPQRVERRLLIKCAADIPPEPVEWLWSGRIAIGKQTLFAGEAGLGKSQVTNAIAAAVTTGGYWPCGEGKAPLGSVIFLCAEDGAGDTIVPRLMAAGAVLDKVHVVTAVRAENGRGQYAFNLTSDLDLLEREIERIGDCRVVFIDPISSYLGGKVDSHVNAAVRGVLEPIGEMAARHRVAIVSVTHPPKGTGTTAINRFIGSIAFVAAARAAFMVTRDPDDDDRRLFLPVKNNLAPLGKGLAFRLEQRIVGQPDKGIVASNVAWETKHVELTADAALQAADARAGGASPSGEADDFLRDLLRGGAVPQRDVKDAAEGAGLAWATVRRAKDRLDVIAHREGGLGDKGRWMWGLPSKVLAETLRCSPLGMSTLGVDEHLNEPLPGQMNRYKKCGACLEPGELLLCSHCGVEFWVHPDCIDAWIEQYEGRPSECGST